MPAPSSGSPSPTSTTAGASPAASPTAATPSQASDTATASAGPTLQKGLIPPASLPAATAEQWAAEGPASNRIVAGHDINENECATVDGATAWVQQGYIGGDGQNSAVQDTFTFADAAAAQSAFRGVVVGMDGCQQTSRAMQGSNKTPADAVVLDTATQGQAEAWKRTWTGVEGLSAAGPQTNHLYLAVYANRLIVLQFTEFPGASAPYNVAADPQVLAMLHTELAG